MKQNVSLLHYGKMQKKEYKKYSVFIIFGMIFSYFFELFFIFFIHIHIKTNEIHDDIIHNQR